MRLSDRYQVNPSLHTSNPVFEVDTMHVTAAHCFTSTTSACISFTQQEEGRKSMACNSQSSHKSHGSVNLFSVTDCATIKHFISSLRKRNAPPHKDNFTALLPTLKTQVPFFVQKVENIIIGLTIYTNTPYMLNTVNMFPFFWLCVIIDRTLLFF